jgi:hypothetical protein
MKNAAKSVLDNAVKAGTITQAQEDNLLAHPGMLGGRFGFGHRPGPPAAPKQSQTPAATPAAFFSSI